MGNHKKYSRYRAYQYLERGKDYKEFNLAKEVKRVEPYSVPLSKSEAERVQEIAEKCIVISLHDHPVAFPEDMGEIFQYNREGRHCTAYEGLYTSCLDAVFDNLMDGICTVTSKRGWKWNDVLYDLGMRLCDLAHQDFVIQCKKVNDIVQAHNKGRIALIPAVESSSMIENEPDRIDILYGFGVRMMGLVYSESNALGSGLKEEKDGGLTSLGLEAVERMNKIGMAIDLSHCGDVTSLDAIKASKEPVFITHAGARALHNIKRLKPDSVLQACAEKGGIIGIEAAPHTTITTNHPEHTIESVMEHFVYTVKLVGIDNVGFGPDTLYGDHVALHHAFSGHLSIIEATGVHKEVEYVKGMENPSEASWNIIRWLVKHGYSDGEIEKVIGKNALQVLSSIWGN
ncbi:MAG: membrane dipeptidase [Theionarchaea archaeon]|nr:MAG: diguanylate cyclase [Theionarchaea archaeon DG-70]MBU7011620.1 membrane dipeptidase [Theionarchaea archaeon]